MQVTRDPSIEGWLAGLDERLANLERLTRFTRGTASLVWTASTDSATVTVEHELGVTPKVVIVSYGSKPSAGQLVVVWAAGYTATTFEGGAHTAAVISGTVANALNWLAVA